MKRMTLTVLTGVAALTALVAIQGCDVLGGPPTGVAVSAGPDESDSTVVVSWTTPAEGAPDKYMVYFRTSRTRATPSSARRRRPRTFTIPTA